ncbi:hypothetical protein [Streptomyces laurentii]|uniref:hypothetical protein n=1 Tax=Streptomyces laurentii TaxID=39478 RepID=UPI00367EE60F
MKKISRVLAGIPIAAVTALCLQAGPAQALPAPTAPDAPDAPVAPTAPATAGNAGKIGKAAITATYFNFEVTVRTRYSDRFRIWGYNQYGNHVTSPWVNSPSPWTRLDGWYWNNGPANVNHIAIEGYQVSTGKTRWMNCVLPGSSWTEQFDCDGYSSL